LRDSSVGLGVAREESREWIGKGRRSDEKAERGDDGRLNPGAAVNDATASAPTQMLAGVGRECAALACDEECPGDLLSERPVTAELSGVNAIEGAIRKGDVVQAALDLDTRHAADHAVVQGEGLCVGRDRRREA
jgi:hypothetical protein